MENHEKHVLVLEDRLADQATLRSSLKRLGYSASFASYGDEFEGLLATRHYAVILDNNFPLTRGHPVCDGQGARLARRIKRDSPKEIVILHTTGLCEEDITELVRSGIHYVEKGKYRKLRSALEGS